ncbi:hypothetical protein FRC03_010912 [Tulasnella sp. 419]|nr:hypothetical protein FRC02_007007 [Tulasnella sp. 418]KAG8956134.1 hypothetical protein FRC03_010912 [Tulasnella sp. 419]
MEEFNPASFTGFGLDGILASLDLPSSSSLGNQLGLTGLDEYTTNRVFSGFAADGAIGVGEGDDYEDEVDRELEKEEDGGMVKRELGSPQVVDHDMQEPFDHTIFDSPVGGELHDELFGPEPPKKKRKRVKDNVPAKPKDVHELFPSFEPGKVLNFSDLFKGRVIKKPRTRYKPLNVEPVAPREKESTRPQTLPALIGDAKKQVQKGHDVELERVIDPDADLRRILQARTSAVIRANSKGKENENNQLSVTPIFIPLDDRSYDLVLLSDWERNIMYEPPSAPEPYGPPSATSSLELSKPTNKYIDSEDWLQTIIWDNRRPPVKDFRLLEFDEDLLQKDQPPPPPSAMKSTESAKPRKRVRMESSNPKDKFNLSNDRYYEVSKDRQRVRQTFGQLIVEHAYPAQKLQLPFYKTRLSKQEARSWHRPPLQFPLNVELHFNKVRSAKKKKDKAGRKITRGDLTEGLRTTGDLSLRDTSTFVLWEYSEEYPPVLSNFGMGSVLVNYYRKRDEKDEHVPKLDIGEPFILEPADESPFMKLGSVYPGQTVPALYNNLVRAPLFRHKPASTEFLVVRSTTRGETKYYIREIKNVFVVGQTYPVTEVPGPHSRKITNTIKSRLQVIAYKMIAKSKGERLKINRLMRYFPDQNELQMRQRLKPFIKEFMEFHRRGPHQGFWRLKTGIPVPSDADLLKLVLPENVVLSESMQVGQRHLLDAGYGKAADGGVDDKETDETNLSTEQRLAPWITTKNFLNATQGKAMLKLHGEGDPTGRGEAFSFIRVSMKEIFVKAGEDPVAKAAEAAARPKSQHRYNVHEQQQTYRAEVDRIWNAQFKSLSNKVPPELTDDEEDEQAPQQRQGSTKPKEGSPMFASSPMPGGMSTRPQSRAASVVGDGASIDGRGNDPAANRVLRIRRLIDGVWRMEIVRDPRVIPAYLDKRRELEEDLIEPEDHIATGNKEVDERALAKLREKIARAKKNQERRIQRKNAQAVKTGGVPLNIGNQPLKSDTSRKCGNCGQVGHMKTNRKCPRWHEFNSDGATGGANIGSPAPPLGGSPPPPSASAMSPGGSGVNLGLPRESYFASSRHPSYAAVPSPLATSPPLSAMDDAFGGAGGASPAPSNSGPKIKLKIGKS